MRFARQNILGRRLLILILAASSIVTLVLTAVQLYRDYRQDRAYIDDRLQQIQVSSLATLVHNLWIVNHQALQTQVDGLYRLPDIQYVAVENSTGQVVVSAGQAREAGIVERIYPLAYTFEGAKVDLGRLRVSAHLDGVYQRLYDKAIVILAGQAVKTFLISVFVLFIIHYIVTRRLNSLSRYSQQIRAEDVAPFPEDVVSSGKAADELTELASAMQDMQARLAGSFAELRASRERFRWIFEGSHDVILVIDPATGIIRDGNPQAAALFGYKPKSLKGLPIAKFIAADTALTRFNHAVSKTRQRVSAPPVEIDVSTGEGLRTVEMAVSMIQYGEEEVALIIARDQTERRRVQAQIEHLAYHDALTGLPNRTLLRDRIGMAAAHARRHDYRGPLLFLDLDHFKDVNDSLGHSVGDLLLAEAARRLQTGLRANDTVARLGGDEFVVLLDSADETREDCLARATTVAQKLRAVLYQPWSTAGQEVHMAASIGITVYPDDGATADELLRRADAAMYLAKAEGRDSICVYRPDLEHNVLQKLTMGSALRRALAQGEFVLHYQQQIELVDRVPVGAEALIRWERPGHGLVSPGEFLPYLDDAGLAEDVGLWVLRTAGRQWVKARRHGQIAESFQIAVNVSARQFKARDFVAKVRAILAETGLPGANLELEITEQALVSDLDDAAAKIRALKDDGVAFAIDDFGTGYSSLSYLHRLPVDAVKIDRSFVALIDSGQQREAGLVDSIVEMGRRLHLRVIAEGVETEAQERYLRRLNCECAQGFLFSVPDVWEALPIFEPARTVS